MKIKIDEIHDLKVEKKGEVYEVTFTEYGKPLGMPEHWLTLEDIQEEWGIKIA